MCITHLNKQFATTQAAELIIHIFNKFDKQCEFITDI
jgi:hypothetical protein